MGSASIAHEAEGQMECHMTHFSIYVAVESWHQKQVQNQNAVEHAHTIMPQNCVAKETFIQKTVYGQAAAAVLHLMLNSSCVALQITFHPREEQTQDAAEPKDMILQSKDVVLAM